MINTKITEIKITETETEMIETINTMVIEMEIDIINRIIRESTKHGSDAGGSYDSNRDLLEESIDAWLKLKNVTNKYYVGEDWNSGYIQIFKKN